MQHWSASEYQAWFWAFRFPSVICRATFSIFTQFRFGHQPLLEGLNSVVGKGIIALSYFHFSPFLIDLKMSSVLLWQHLKKWSCTVALFAWVGIKLAKPSTTLGHVSYHSLCCWCVTQPVKHSSLKNNWVLFLPTAVSRLLHHFTILK